MGSLRFSPAIKLSRYGHPSLLWCIPLVAAVALLPFALPRSAILSSLKTIHQIQLQIVLEYLSKFVVL